MDSLNIAKVTLLPLERKYEVINSAEKLKPLVLWKRDAMSHDNPMNVNTSEKKGVPDIESAPSPVVLPETRTVLNGELIRIDEIAGELIWELKGQA
jgi:hypothetical protein